MCVCVSQGPSFVPIGREEEELSTRIEKTNKTIVRQRDDYATHGLWMTLRYCPVTAVVSRIRIILLSRDIFGAVVHVKTVHTAVVSRIRQSQYVPFVSKMPFDVQTR